VRARRPHAGRRARGRVTHRFSVAARGLFVSLGRGSWFVVL
jgi:hypothetical protein